MPRKVEEVPQSESESESSQQFVPQDDDAETLWKVIEITNERSRQYQVRWEGINPATNKPWPLDWVPKSDCTPDLVKAWKTKKANRKSKGALYS